VFVFYDRPFLHVCNLQRTHTHLFNGSLSGTTQVSRYQKGKTNLDLTEARDSEWQWHQLVHMQVCTSLQTDNHASTPPLSVLTGQMPFLPTNQQHQSMQALCAYCAKKIYIIFHSNICLHFSDYVVFYGYITKSTEVQTREESSYSETVLELTGPLILNHILT